MEAFPHIYKVGAELEGSYVKVTSTGLEALTTAAPAEFDGPGDQWSPETLFAAAVADCFILSFKAIAAASRFDYRGISCEAEAKLDRVDKVTSFTEVKVIASLTVSTEDQVDRGLKLLEKAEHNCLITNSLKSTLTLDPTVTVA